MKLFKSLFGLPDASGDEDNYGIPWKYMKSAADLDLIESGRATRPQILFKHSTSCGLSSMMLRRFERRWEAVSHLADFYFLDLIANRELSNAVAQRFGVPHQSPQLLILGQEGGPEHFSHGDIGAIAPENVLKNPD
ncbi:bacillithiol system redox-active protein YtxJ [Robiginitalea sp.]|jgi:bacillithiol system protein YtxJ|uniref:bacillithiol system redox-active protein YtxJ n=1 Tax=Robiginitalea sp. TaxID=1902411 RepID=UPI003C77CA73